MSDVQIAASLAALAGVSVVFVVWTRREARAGNPGAWRGALAAGWAMVLLGLCLWTVSASPDRGLALGVVMVMAAAFACLGWQGLRQAGQPLRRKRKRAAGGVVDGNVRPAGYWGRFIVRLAGSLIVVPAASLSIGLAWRMAMPGDDGDRLMAAALLAVLAAALGWVVQLASRRPYRTCAGLGIAGAIAAGFVFLPRIL